MANTSKINGFRPVKHLTGAPYNGQFNVYHVPASDGVAIYPGDVVKLAGSSSTDGTKPTVTLGSAGDAIVGVVVGFSPNRDDLNLSGQKRTASTARDVYVADSPDLVFVVEASNGTPAVTDVGLNADHATGSPVSATSTSGAYLDFGTEVTSADHTFKIIGFAPVVDNEVGASAKLLVTINKHQLAPGTVGV